MVARHDILDRPESLWTPLVGSILFHGAVAAMIFALGMIPAANLVQWGDPASLGGGAVSVTPVSRIPLPPRAGPINPLANDTQSQVPAPPPDVRPQPKQEAPKDEPDAIPLKSRQAEAARRAPRSSARRPADTGDSQLYSRGGAAAVSPMFGSTSGGSGIGIGQGNPFGDRFGAYVAILRQMVASKWNTSQVDARLQTAPPVIVLFEIQKDGRIRNLRLLQRSGISPLDYSAMRAVSEASPFPPLPRGFERDSAAVEFWFQLKR
jgi:protein TonB